VCSEGGGNGEKKVIKKIRQKKDGRALISGIASTVRVVAIKIGFRKNGVMIFQNVVEVPKPRLEVKRKRFRNNQLEEKKEK